MATIVNIPRDERNAELGAGLTSAIDKIMSAKLKKGEENQNLTALQAAMNAPDEVSGLTELLGKMDQGTDPQRVALMAELVKERHRGTQPVTPTDAGKIEAAWATAQSRIQSAASIANAQMENTRNEGRLNRESQQGMPDIRAQANILAENVKTAQDAGKAASEVIDALDTIDPLIRDRRVKTGPLAPLAMKAQGIISEFGLNNQQIDQFLIGDPAAAAALNAAHAKFTLNALGGRLGSGMSDADRETVAKIGPGVSQTAEGNELMSAIARSAAEKTKAIAKEVAKMQNAGAKLPAINARIEELRNSTSVITPELRQKIEMINSTPGTDPTEPKTGITGGSWKWVEQGQQ
jgi:hypothetical protein